MEYIPRDGATSRSRKYSYKYLQTGGSMAPYFKQLAASLGYTIIKDSIHSNGVNRV